MFFPPIPLLWFIYIRIQRDQGSCSQLTEIWPGRVSNEACVDNPALLSARSIFHFQGEHSNPQKKQRRRTWTRYPGFCAQAAVVYWQAVRGRRSRVCCNLKSNQNDEEISTMYNLWHGWQKCATIKPNNLSGIVIFIQAPSNQILPQHWPPNSN